MDPVFLVLIGMGVASGATALVEWGRRVRRSRRRIRDAVSTSLEGRSGAALRAGVAKPLRELRAPFSGEACVGYALRVDGIPGIATRGPSWFEAERSVDFELEADGVRLLVRAPFLCCGAQAQSQRGPARELLATEERRALVAREGIAVELIPPEAPLTVEERLLRPETRLVVLGEESQEPSADGYRDRFRSVLRAPRDAPLVVTDHAPVDVTASWLAAEIARRGS